MQQARSIVNEPDFVRMMACQMPSDLRTNFMCAIVIPNASIIAGNVSLASCIHVTATGHGSSLQTFINITQPAERNGGRSAPQH